MKTRISILLLLVATIAFADSSAVVVSSEEGRRLVEEGRMELIQPDSPALRAERRRLERSIVEAYLKSHPEHAATGELLLAEEPAGPRTITIGEERDVPQTVTLQGNDLAIGELAGSLVKATDAANALAIYARLYAWAEPSAVLRESGLPSPEALAGASVEEIKHNTSVLVAQRLTIKKQLPLPPNPVDDYPYIGPYTVPTECVGGFKADAGNGYGGDQYKEGGQTCDLSWDGILANDARPYRNHLSCVRNQAHRGTCGAFAVASALEMAFSQTQSQHINLSEQMLYFRYKAKGLEAYDDDGMNIPDAVEQFVTYQRTIPYELAWNYNPSLDRTWVGGGGLFLWDASCNAYNEECSDTTPQGEYTCFRKSVREKLSSKLCGLVAPPNVGGVRVTTPTMSAWDPEDANGSIDTIKTLLDAGTPITLSIMVNNSFKAAGKNGGYLEYKGEGESNWGSHAVHVVHYIENDELAAIVPGAPPGDAGPFAPDGDEGGYFIVRNSWGSCWGDGGYVYIPYRWLRVAAFVHAAHAYDPGSVLPAP